MRIALTQYLVYNSAVVQRISMNEMGIIAQYAGKNTKKVEIIIFDSDVQ
jgi:hypothetical protein